MRLTRREAWQAAGGWLTALAGLAVRDRREPIYDESGTLIGWCDRDAPWWP